MPPKKNPKKGAKKPAASKVPFKMNTRRTARGTPSEESQASGQDSPDPNTEEAGSAQPTSQPARRVSPRIAARRLQTESAAQEEVADTEQTTEDETEQTGDKRKRQTKKTANKDNTQGEEPLSNMNEAGPSTEAQQTTEPDPEPPKKAARTTKKNTPGKTAKQAKEAKGKKTVTFAPSTNDSDIEMEDADKPQEKKKPAPRKKKSKMAAPTAIAQVTGGQIVSTEVSSGGVEPQSNIPQQFRDIQPALTPAASQPLAQPMPAYQQDPSGALQFTQVAGPSYMHNQNNPPQQGQNVYFNDAHRRAAEESQRYEQQRRQQVVQQPHQWQGFGPAPGFGNQQPQVYGGQQPQAFGAPQHQASPAPQPQASQAPQPQASPAPRRRGLAGIIGDMVDKSNARDQRKKSQQAQPHQPQGQGQTQGLQWPPAIPQLQDPQQVLPQQTQLQGQAQGLQWPQTIPQPQWPQQVQVQQPRDNQTTQAPSTKPKQTKPASPKSLKARSALRGKLFEALAAGDAAEYAKLQQENANHLTAELLRRNREAQGLTQGRALDSVAENYTFVNSGIAKYAQPERQRADEQMTGTQDPQTNDVAEQPSHDPQPAPEDEADEGGDGDEADESEESDEEEEEDESDESEDDEEQTINPDDSLIDPALAGAADTEVDPNTLPATTTDRSRTRRAGTKLKKMQAEREQQQELLQQNLQQQHHDQQLRSQQQMHQLQQQQSSNANNQDVEMSDWTPWQGMSDEDANQAFGHLTHPNTGVAQFPHTTTEIPSIDDSLTVWTGGNQLQGRGADELYDDESNDRPHDELLDPPPIVGAGDPNYPVEPLDALIRSLPHRQPDIYNTGNSSGSGLNVNRPVRAPNSRTNQKGKGAQKKGKGPKK